MKSSLQRNKTFTSSKEFSFPKANPCADKISFKIESIQSPKIPANDSDFCESPKVGSTYAVQKKQQNSCKVRGAKVH